MKKILLTAIAITIAMSCCAQGAVTMSNDSLFYNGKRVAVGDTVKLGYGSNPNKDFAFVYTSGGLALNQPLPAARFKTSMVITKVYKSYGKYLFKAKAIDAGSMKLIIDIEGAVDNKELIL